MRLAPLALGLALGLAAACKGAAELGGLEYPCNRAAADLDGPPQCPEAMHCGLEDAEGHGRCRLRGAGVPWRCEAEKNDCDDGWGCGPNGFCRRSDTTPSTSCVADRDCDPGFLCGLEHECRDATVNGPYRCSSDAECVPSWACGVEGRCVDPSLQAESPQAPFGRLVDAGLVSPLGRPELPDHVSASVSQTRQSFARSYGQTLELLSADKPQDFLSPTSRFTTLALPSAPREVMMYGGVTSVLLSDGLWAVDGGALVPTLPELAFATHLRLALGASGAKSLLLAFSASQYAVAQVQVDGTFALLPVTDGGVIDGVTGAGPETIVDLASLPLKDELLAATPDGLFIRPLPSAGGPGAFLPVAAGSFGNPGCPGFTPTSPALTPTALYSLGAYSAYVVGRDASGGWYLGAIIHSSGAAPFCGASVTASTACPICAGGEFVSLFPSSPAKVRCRLTLDGGVFEQTRGVDMGSCTNYPATLPEPPWRESEAVALDVTFRPYGRVRVGPTAFVSESAPTTLREHDGRLFALGPLGHYWSDPSLGLVGIYPDAYFAQTSGDPLVLVRFVSQLFSVPVSGPPVQLASFAPASSGQSQRFGAHLAATPDGGTWALVTSGDLMLAGDVSATASGASTALPVLETRLSPSPRMDILSSVVLPPSASAPASLLAGYVLTSNQLAYFRAISEQRWETVPVPAPDGDWLELFLAGGDAHLGYRDGRVFALPGRLQVAPEAPSPVSDFAFLCGRTYAVSRAGLFRLEPQPSGPGRWERETGYLGLLPPGTAADHGASSRLFALGHALYLATGDGFLPRLPAEGAGCP